MPQSIPPRPLDIDPEPLARVQQAIDDIRAGKMVILVDDEDRENEGDLTMAAEMVTPEAINFMAKFGRGLICLSLTDDQLKKLELPMMVENNSSPFETAFTVSTSAMRGPAAVAGNRQMAWMSLLAMPLDSVSTRCQVSGA